MKKSWKIVKIPDVLFFQEGPGVRKHQFTSSGVKLLNVGNINNGQIDLSRTKIYVSEEEAFGKYKHFLVDEGDLVVASSGIVVNNFHNKIAFIRKEHLPLCMNTSTIRFKTIDNKVIDIHYFKYFLKTNFFSNQLQKLITGSAQLNFGPSHLNKIELMLPPLEEQKSIVKVLDHAESLYRKRKQTIKLLDEYFKSVFLEMFGDPINNTKNWKIKKFEEVGSLDRGISKHRPRNAPDLLGGNHPLIQTGDVANADIYIETYKATYSDLGLKQSKKWPKGTLCITIAANIAKTGILNFDACFPDSVVGFVADVKQTNNIFIHFWMSFLQEILERNAPESAQKNINLKILRELDVIMPPIELQNKFTLAVQHAESIKAKMLLQDNLFEVQFQSLLQRSFGSS